MKPIRIREATIRIREASWPADRMAFETVRCEVFVREQHVPRSLEFDGLDSSALHWMAFTPEKEPVGTLRLLPSGQIGRAAVLRAYRGQGVGSVCCVMRLPRRRRTAGAKSG